VTASQIDVFRNSEIFKNVFRYFYEFDQSALLELGFLQGWSWNHRKHNRGKMRKFSRELAAGCEYVVTPVGGPLVLGLKEAVPTCKSSRSILATFESLPNDRRRIIDCLERDFGHKMFQEDQCNHRVSSVVLRKSAI